jgi:hypothetical protein
MSLPNNKHKSSHQKFSPPKNVSTQQQAQIFPLKYPSTQQAKISSATILFTLDQKSLHPTKQKSVQQKCTLAIKKQKVSPIF